MKARFLLSGLVVWFSGLAGAYYLGQQSYQSPASDSSELAAPSLPGESNLQNNSVAESASQELAESTLEAVAPNLDAALQELGSLNESQTRELLAEALALPQSDFRRARMIRGLLGQLAESKPEEALALADTIGSLRDSEQARRNILEIWGRNDPQAALKWSQLALADEPMRARRSQLLAIYRGFGRGQPAAAFNSALALPSDNRSDQRLRNDALEEIIETEIKNGGLLAARQRIELMQDDPTKNNLVRELVDEWASYDPEGAASYVQAMGDTASTSVKTALLGEWAENDPAAAAAWLVAQDPDKEVLARASTEIIRQWTRFDMAASAEWLNSMSSSPELDRAVISYTFQAAREDPASAMTWAESINNDRMRTHMMERVAGSWKADDPESFKNYLNRSELNEAQRSLLENAREFPGGRRWR